MQQRHNVRAGAWRGRAGLVVKAGLQELEEAYYLALRVPSECPLGRRSLRRRRDHTVHGTESYVPIAGIPGFQKSIDSAINSDY